MISFSKFIISAVGVGSVLGANTDWVYPSTDWTDTCKTGSKQSPIALSPPSTKDEKTIPTIVFSDKFGTTGSVKNDGKKIYITTSYATNSYNDFMLPTASNDNDSYDYQRMDIHIPAEHTLNGTTADIEFQLVYKNKSSSAYTIVSVLGKSVASGYVNLAGMTGLKGLSADKLKENNAISTNNAGIISLHEDLVRYVPFVNTWMYDGSWTWPNNNANDAATSGDCTENVKWYVFGATIKLEKAAVDHLKTALTAQAGIPTTGNARTLKTNSLTTKDMLTAIGGASAALPSVVLALLVAAFTF